MNLRRVRLVVLLVVWNILTAVFAFAYYDRYWKWRDCFNDLGRCYDSSTATVYLEQAGIVWGGLAVIFALLWAGAIWKLTRQAR